MQEVISVRFRGGCKTYYFDPRGVKVSAGTDVIVETAQGLEFGQCSTGNQQIPDAAVVQPLRPMVRIATENDRRTVALNRKRESDAFDICEKRILEHGLDMKLVRVEYSFDSSKIIFFFTAEGRVDFRELVKDLAGVFRARIELRQIGVRDEAKMLGGLGICGRPFCCSDFLDEFIPVSIKMAKTQNLSLNPTKISGTCGRLMCCLKYEQDAYEDAARRMPKNDSFVQTPDGPGSITSIDLLREQATVRLDSEPESPKKYRPCEMCVLRNGKGSRDGITIPDKLPERYVAPVKTESSGIQSVFFEPEAETAASAPESSDTLSVRTERRSRGHRGGRGHGGGGNPAAAPKEKAEIRERSAAAPNRGGNNAPKSAPKPAPKSAAAPAAAPAEGKSGEAHARRRHRGGRGRHKGGSGNGAPKGEA